MSLTFVSRRILAATCMRHCARYCMGGWLELDHVLGAGHDGGDNLPGGGASAAHGELPSM
jgi:hypothetical protein